MAFEDNDESPFVRNFKTTVFKSDINILYWFCGVFGGLVLFLSTLVAFIIKKLITDPIIKLKSKVEKNDLEFETANQ